MYICNMDIQEARRIKVRLEIEIYKKIQEFTKKTGYDVKDIIFEKEFNDRYKLELVINL